MSNVKTVKLDKKYQHNIQDFEQEQKIVYDVIDKTFNKFQNESNYNTKEYATDILLNDYTYIPNDTVLSEGRYIRYLDLKNPLEIKLRIGGFLLSDNGYTVHLKGPKKIFRVSKRNSLFFSQITDNDKVRVAIHDYV